MKRAVVLIVALATAACWGRNGYVPTGNNTSPDGDDEDVTVARDAAAAEDDAGLAPDASDVADGSTDFPANDADVAPEVDSGGGQPEPEAGVF